MDDALLPLDRPLPTALGGAAYGGLLRYRRWPVFSPAWVRGRTLLWGALALLVLVPLGFSGDDQPALPLWALVPLALQTLGPIVVGPWLASLVRRRGLPPAREWWALVAAVTSVAAVTLAFNAFGSEPLKQSLAQWTGVVDAQGQRPRLRVVLGISVAAPDAPPPKPPSPSGADTRGPTDYIGLGLIVFLLAGGPGLLAWRREREGLARLRQEEALRREEAKRREAEMKLSVLAAQVEPHFLFNTLAGVRSAIVGDPARASDMVDRLVDYLRASIPRLRADDIASASLRGQLEIVHAYLALMRARMPRLALRVDVPEELLTARFPPLMLISLAENAVKHGVEPKMGAATVCVGARALPDGRLEVTVADDGVGFDGAGAQAGSGLGLTNIRERLAELYGERGELRLRARPEGGVAASIVLPLQWSDERAQHPERTP